MSTLADKALTVALSGDKRKVRKFERKHIKRLWEKLRDVKEDLRGARKRNKHLMDLHDKHTAEIATLRAQAAAPIEVTVEMGRVGREAFRVAILGRHTSSDEDFATGIRAALAARPGAAP